MGNAALLGGRLRKSYVMNIDSDYMRLALAALRTSGLTPFRQGVQDREHLARVSLQQIARGKTTPGMQRVHQSKLE